MPVDPKISKDTKKTLERNNCLKIFFMMLGILIKVLANQK